MVNLKDNLPLGIVMTGPLIKMVKGVVGGFVGDSRFKSQWG